MSGIYTLSRMLVAFFGFTTFLGVLWFSDSLGGILIISGVLMGFSSVAISFIPQRKLSSPTTRRTLIMLCVIATGAGFVLLASDFSAPNGIEWDVVAIRVIHITALATIAIKALNWPPASNVGQKG